MLVYSQSEGQQQHTAHVSQGKKERKDTPGCCNSQSSHIRSYHLPLSALGFCKRGLEGSAEAEQKSE